MSLVECRNCGAVIEDGSSGEHSAPPPRPEHCNQCPPTRCEDCGGICDWQSGALCSCWIDLRGLPLADVKALFAEHDADLSIDPQGPDA